MDKLSHFLFFADDLSPDTVTLDSSESRHAASVLRVPAGTALSITDGKGTLATGVCEPAKGSALTIRITGRTRIPRRTPQVTLCIGLPDRDAFEDLLTDATALGVARVVPVAAQYCQKKWWGYDWKKISIRFRLKMIAALKQSQNAFLPELTPPSTTADAAKLVDGAMVLVADPSGKPLRELKILPDTGPIACFVGPPGGFSDHELSLLTERSGMPVVIAPARLRTELAATVMCAQITGYTLQFLQ